MINAKNIVNKLKGESDRGPKNYYLTRSLVKEFETLCEKDKVSPSNVVEELIRAFIDSHKESKPKTIKPKKPRKS